MGIRGMDVDDFPVVAHSVQRAEPRPKVVDLHLLLHALEHSLPGRRLDPVATLPAVGVPRPASVRPESAK